MPRPSVTAVLPNFNRHSRLRTAVASVLTQTFEDFELVIVDDASTEADELSPGEFGDERVRMITRDQNGGVAAAQNSGLQAARGEFVAFLHSDDTWDRDKLAHQVGELCSAPEAFGIESATVRTSDAGITTVSPRLEGATFDQFLARTVRNVHISGFLFRRQALVDISGFDERLRSYEDFDLLVRLLREGSFIFSHQPVASLDQRGSDRLGESPWMATARCSLLDKYGAELTDRFGRLPDNWRDWSIQAAVDALADGERAVARAQLRRAGHGRRSDWVRRSPLWAASYLGDAASSSIAKRTRSRWVQ